MQLPLLVLLIGVGIGLLFAGFGLYKQNEAKKINQARAEEALRQSEESVKAANKRLEEIVEEYDELNKQYKAKQEECDSIVMGSDNWFNLKNKCTTEKQQLQSKIWSLEAEDTMIKSKDYTVYYSLVKPMSYQIFYIIGGAIAGLAALGAFIIYLVKGKKTY